MDMNISLFPQNASFSPIPFPLRRLKPQQKFFLVSFRCRNPSRRGFWIGFHLSAHFFLFFSIPIFLPSFLSSFTFITVPTPKSIMFCPSRIFLPEPRDLQDIQQ